MGLRVLGDEQCCELACNGGACETCPCCSAGWCVSGADGQIPDTKDPNFETWLEVAAEHNPVAAALLAARKPTPAAAAEPSMAETSLRRLADYVVVQPDYDGWKKDDGAVDNAISLLERRKHQQPA